METRDIEQEVAPVLARARAITVNSNEACTEATAFVVQVKQAHKRAAEFFKPTCETTHAAHKAATGARDAILKPLKAAEDAINAACLRYYREQEDKRLAAAREAQAKIDETARRECERLEKMAAKVKTPEKQEEYRQAAAAVIAPTVQMASTIAPQIGRAIVKRWTFEVVDPLKVPREFLEVDEEKMSKYATAMKEMAKVDGVKFFQKESFSTRV